MPKRFDRIHPCRTAGRVESEHHADQHRDAESQRDRPGNDLRRDIAHRFGHRGVDVGHRGFDQCPGAADHGSAGQAARDARQAADHRRHDRLDEKLPRNVAAFGSQGPANAD